MSVVISMMLLVCYFIVLFLDVFLCMGYGYECGDNINDLLVVL